ncbi:hypothetical protein OG239_00755 [Streptomyces sp. NBC_00868]|uniref:hypothetical protein n=1 Tax=Streptomyces sp. NBC_00868 TaxID=2903683 RepID=UPI00386F3EE4|nr:hypothetical protein OG239_00755 [Streptomyces sp. NBC_00868]
MPLEQVAVVLSARGAPTVRRPEPSFEQDWPARIPHITGDCVRETGHRVERMTRQAPLAVLGFRLDEAGVRGSAAPLPLSPLF